MAMNEAEEPARWLLLVHQLPAKPASERVKLWRRLRALGAVALKNAVYALPASDQAREDFEWMLKEINGIAGEALICEARLLNGLSDQDVRALFAAARDEDYAALAKEARALGEHLSQDPPLLTLADATARVARLKASVAQIVAIDFFGAGGREAVDGLLATLDARLQDRSATTRRATARKPDTMADLKNRVWVTRQGVHVDRIASAWLIRRFIDPDALFKFVPGKDYRPQPDEIRFDMFEAEFGHEGDCCTFEVLLSRLGLADPALTAIAEIVHDIDLKDEKFGRPETAGIAHLIAGLAMTTDDDTQRIERGAVMLDGLYQYARKSPA
jgi:hypothetical protein